MSRSQFVSRREFVVRGAAGFAAPALFNSDRANAADFVTVQIENGRIRGQSESGAVSFKGVPYAADTGGANRFRAPQPVTGWAGVRDALQFGDRCPQARSPVAEPGATGGPAYSENCCVLNVYSPDINSSARRPVMVYLHGGGFSGGSGDSPTLNGANLARSGNVVVVTLNHRLNLFGFTHLGFLNSDFADSANVGQLDLIAALKWVRNNIGAFGGDPARVTVFGQSGGGSKIEVLLVMPGANGLFRGTINMSGSSAYAIELASQREALTLEFLKQLGIGKDDLRKLQQPTPDQLLAAHKAAAAKLNIDSNHRPVIDGRHILHAPLSPEGLAMQVSVPQIISSTLTEATGFLRVDQRKVQMSEDSVKARLKAQFALNDASVDAVVDGYRQDEPQRSPWDVLVAVATDALVLGPQLQAAERKAAAGNRHIYVSEFTWSSPVDGGIWGAPHAIDIPFAFGNLDKNRLTMGADPLAEKVSRSEMSAFVAFAQTGDPNNPLVPSWQPYGATSRQTMIVNEPCRLVNDFLSGDRRTWLKLPHQDAFALVDGPLFRSST